MPLLVLPGLMHMAAFSQSISCPRRSTMDSLICLTIGAGYQVRCLGSSPHGFSSSSKSQVASLLMATGQHSKRAKEELSGTLRLRIQNMQCHFHHILFLKVGYEIHLDLRRWGKSFHFWLRGAEKLNHSGVWSKKLVIKCN